MLDLGVPESELGPIPPPNPGPKNEGGVYAASMGEPMEVDDSEGTSGYESDGESIIEELMYIFQRMKISE
jgi:hypothetical protein